MPGRTRCLLYDVAPLSEEVSVSVQPEGRGVSQNRHGQPERDIPDIGVDAMVVVRLPDLQQPDK